MKKFLISALACLMLFFNLAGTTGKVFAATGAPIAENLELRTYRNTSVSGTLSAYDPEDDVINFEITTVPIKGKISLEANGSFIYTPDDGKKGRDYFGYKALDSMGNYSQEATVIIRIEKQKSNLVYSDMKDRAAEYAAVFLSENDIFTGEKIGNNFCFQPDKQVSRGEFLSMCMLVADTPLVKGVLSTGFTDDETIPFWLKEYVATAAIQGINNSNELQYFEAESSISISEAMQILNDALRLNDVSYIDISTEAETSGLQACMNLSASGIIDKNIVAEDYLNREDAALMLYKAMETMALR